jgi:hypothetical protein
LFEKIVLLVNPCAWAQTAGAKSEVSQQLLSRRRSSTVNNNMALDASELFCENHCIRKIESNGMAVTVAVNVNGDLYVSLSRNHKTRKINRH